MATETKQPALGDITDVPGASNSLEIVDLARFAVEEQNKRENSVLELVRVISAKQQVVSGMNYYITLEAKDGEIKKEYEAKVWVRNWLNSKELLEFNPKPVFGAFTDIVPPHSVEVDNLARFAVDQHNKEKNANLEFVRVISAKQQAVKGFMFYITLEAKHGDTKNVYETKVLVRPLLNPNELLEFKLSTPIIDGFTDIVPPHSDEVDNLARFAVDQHNKKENANLEFVKVISAKLQLVEGSKYYITLEAKDGEIKKEYEAKVWVRNWLNSKELLEFNPKPIFGAFTHIVPPHSDEVDNLARFAVDQHNKEKNANLEFVKVISAKQQVVEGFIFYIALEAKNCETKNVYETKVLVRPLLNPKDVLEFKPISVNPLSVSV